MSIRQSIRARKRPASRVLSLLALLYSVYSAYMLCFTQFTCLLGRRARERFGRQFACFALLGLLSLHALLYSVYLPAGASRPRALRPSVCLLYSVLLALLSLLACLGVAPARDSAVSLLALLSFTCFTQVTCLLGRRAREHFSLRPQAWLRHEYFGGLSVSVFQSPKDHFALALQPA